MPRKPVPQPVQDTPPGPIQLEVRVDDKIQFLQRVYSYSIDQESDSFAVYGSLKPAGASSGSGSLGATAAVVEPSADDSE